MSLITKIPGVTFTDTSLPKLYHDAVITTGTKYVFDAGDTYSFAKQATPTAGVDVWSDLTPNDSPAAFAGTVPFASGGFSFDPTAFGNTITLPTSGKFAAGADGFLFTIWLKHLAAATAAYSGIAGLADSTTPGVNQFSIDSGPANSGQYRLCADGLISAYPTPAVNSINQFAISAKKNGGGTYDYFYYQNGVLLSTVTAGRTALGQSTLMASPVIGYVNGFSFGAHFRAFRAWQDDTSTLTNQAAITALVLKDYNANVGRFS